MRVSQFADLDEARAYYLALADHAAQAAFEKSGYLATVHDIKHREALAGGGPLLEREAAQSGEKSADLAARVLERRQEMETALAAIEVSRIDTRRRIRDAADIATMYAALAEHKAALAAL
ncbi:hypothetical protein P3W43_01535 [Salinicola salarius]|uniref:hypothetical protein n=1 Tax=Salinicola salarius TaxID=430457 RepID=UPI0023E3DBC8|nr:hypothetical protein [Salinicola salarius]MDF3917531.1 hypothetical protein [Salinicola salarius]